MSNTLSDVVITNNIEEELRNFFAQHKFTKTGILLDENTRKFCLPLIEGVLPELSCTIEIQSGEEQKHLDTCSAIWKELTDAEFDRKSLLINLGGGVIGDMGGFCAATFKRGISFINIPTTLLAQVDASVGGKLGIDFLGFKNHIGVFKDPLRVFISFQFLKSLDKRELRSGFAEVIKHCLIADEAKFKEIASRSLGGQNWEDIISHSVDIKNQVVTEDPEERGLRKILNFGHTIGHAVETYYLNAGKRILHGEAIAVGMVCEAWLSTVKCNLSQDAGETIFKYIDSVYNLFPVEEEAFANIADLSTQDKKNEGSVIKASLLSDIGKCLYNISVTKDELVQALKNYNERVKAVPK